MFEEIHRSNMTKDNSDSRKLVKGKLVKGPDYQPPDIARILAAEKRTAQAEADAG